MRQITVGKNDAGQRLDKFLTKTYRKLPQSMLYKGIRTKNIKLNGKRCQISTRVQEGDVVSLYLKEEFFEGTPAEYDFLKAPKMVDCVYEDENILLLNKKPGLLVHPDENYHFDSLIARVQHYLYDKGEYRPQEENSFAPALVNRIDRNTSGIVIAAKNAESLRILNDKMRDRELHKYYLCVVHGRMEKKSDLLTGYLEKNESKNRVYIFSKPFPGAKTIKTKYWTLQESGKYSLLEIDLLIRAHMASIGHPLVGDGKYGRNSENKESRYKWQALCSYKLVFDFQTDAGILNYLNHKEFCIPNVWFVEDFKNLK